MRLNDMHYHYYHTTYKCDCERLGVLAAVYIPTTPILWVCNTYIVNSKNIHHGGDARPRQSDSPQPPYEMIIII